MLRNIKFKGGGGTDFRPAIAEAATWKTDLLIYLTDLEGDAGNEPLFPVLWAVPEGLAKAPWGRLIELN
jgi:predicted metal-dependent peptidase